MSAAGDQLGAHAVRVDRRGREGGDGVLVQVAGHDDLRVLGAQLVQLLADPVGEQQQVAGVDAYGAEAGPRDLHGGADRLGDVEGVHEQRGAAAEGVDLRLERVPLAVVQQGEGVGAGADGRDVVAEAGRQVGRGVEAAHVGRTGGGDGRQLVGAAGTHLDQRPVAGGHRHAGRGGGHRGVVVEDGEDHRLQEDRFGEGALDPHDRRAGEVDLALRVAPDVAAEAVVGQPVQRARIEDAAFAQEAEDRFVEVEVLHRVQDPAGSGDDSVAAAFGQAPGEDLEDRAAVGGPGPQRGLQHGEFVLVGEERSRRHGHRQPQVCCVHGEMLPPVLVTLTISPGRLCDAPPRVAAWRP